MKNLFLGFAFLFSFVLKAETQIPILKTFNGINIVTLNLAGKDFTFILDTGSNVNFIDPEHMEYLTRNNLFTLDEKLDSKVNTFNSSVNSKGGILKFKLNDLDFAPMITNLMPNKRFTEKLDGVNCCDGILGAPFLKQYPTLYDLNKKIITINPTAKTIADLKEKISFAIVGRDAIILDCKEDEKNYKLRLDTGSEIPLTFHTDFVQSERLFEKVYNKNKMFAPSFVKVDRSVCAKKLKLNLEAYLYTGDAGALSYKEVAGNLGAAALGSEYLIDYKKSVIALKSANNPIDLEGIVPVEINLFEKLPRTDLLQKMELYILNSCVSQDKSAENCFKKWCFIRGFVVDCPLPKSTDLKDLLEVYHQKSIDQYCSLPQLLSYYTKTDANITHPCLWKFHNEIKWNTYFNGIDSKNLAPALPSDTKMQAYFFNDQEKFTKNFYCYALKEKLFKESELPIHLFALSINGISFGKKNYREYIKWQKTKTGLACMKTVIDFFTNNENLDFDLKLLYGAKYGILINEVTHLGDGVKNTIKDTPNEERYEENIDRTLNHERLHVLFSENKDVQKKIKEMVNKLNPADLEAFKTKHPSYDFSNKEILWREYFSYQYEENLSKLLEDFFKK